MNPVRITVAGDTHGDLLWLRAVIIAAAAAGAQVIVQLGDLGIGLDGDDTTFVDTLDALLEEHGLILVFIDGNHDNHDLLAVLERRPDGFAEVTQRILYAPRGHRWNWQNVTFVACGGGVSADREARIDGHTWWAAEELSYRDIMTCIDGGPADVMLSHDAPAGGITLPANVKADAASVAHRNTVYGIVNEIRPELILHGHYHYNHTTELTLDDGTTTIVRGVDRDGTTGGYFTVDVTALVTQS